MSSAPEIDDDLAVTVKRVPGGLVSNWFHDHVSEGDTLEVTKPAGVFCLRDHDRPVVGFVGGSGVTPVMSITKACLPRRPTGPSAVREQGRPASVIFDERSPPCSGPSARFEVRHHLDADGGFLDGPVDREFAGRRVDADFYICGPGPFMDLVEDDAARIRRRAGAS